VSDIALPPARDEDLGADATRFFEDKNLLPERRRSPSGKDPRRSSSDHNNVGFH
jgi:hypothetical protein